jgi:cytochrome c oxidase cbb3-type subunit 1
MNVTETNENKTPCSGMDTSEIDASCRVPLLVLFGGAAFWLVIGMLLALAAAMSFHKPDMFANCACLTYGHAQAASNDLLLYGFALPGALGVMLWVFARLSRAPLALPIVGVAAGNIWHLAVALGTLGILAGHSTGFAWLEYPRIAAVLLFTAFMLVAVTAAATMGMRAERELYPSHWFLFAALLWFAWTYSSANLFLQSPHLPRGVVQAIIDWWFANNVLFVFLGLTGIGIAWYFLPKLANKPLAGPGFALFGFLTLMFFGTWMGIPRSAPVPAWLPSVSTYAAMLSILSVVAIAIVTIRTVWSMGFHISGSPFCFIKFGMVSFVLSSLFYIGEFCPRHSQVTDFTWYNFAISQWQVLGFAGMIVCGGIYYILPRMMGKEMPFGGLAKFSFFLFAIGVLVLVITLIVGGIAQGKHLMNAAAPFAESSTAALFWFRISTTGQLLILLGGLCLLLNVFQMIIQWKLGLLKCVIAGVKAPLEDASASASLRRDQGEVKP